MDSSAVKHKIKLQGPGRRVRRENRRPAALELELPLGLDGALVEDKVQQDVLDDVHGALRDCGFDADEATISYSRKDYLHPELQKFPQGHIQQEFQFLDETLDGG